MFSKYDSIVRGESPKQAAVSFADIPSKRSWIHSFSRLESFAAKETSIPKPISLKYV
jgi:hypothetical protein